MKPHLIQDQTKEKTTVFDTSSGIYPNGDDNQYPILVENLIQSSPTAIQCVDLYSNFLGGAGFVSELDHINLTDNLFAYTPNDLLADISSCLAIHQGVFIHVNYNALFEKDSFKVLPYNTCRLGKKDDKNYNGKILYSPNGWGMDYEQSKVVKFDVFNPHKGIIEAQVEIANGWENYNGQILFFTLQPQKIYPTSLIDSSYLFADTEYRIGLFYNSVAKRGFNGNKIIRYRPQESEEANETVKQSVKELMGINNSNSVIAIEDDWDSSDQEGNFKIDNLDTDIKADRYAHFETSSANYIRKAFKNIPPALIDFVQGKLGNSSGEELKILQSIYNTNTAKDRAKVTRLFKVLFDNYKTPINADWKINQYKVYNDGTTNN